MESKYSHDVFISFSFKDQDHAESLVNILSSRYGISCWICTRDIDGGRRYKKLIPEAIDHAKVVVFLQSSFSIESKEIPKEIGMAFDADKTIIPFKLDDAKLVGDLRYDLYGLEYIDATVPTFDDRVDELAQAIKKVLGHDKQTIRSDAVDVQRIVSTPNVLPKMIFCGRGEILSEINARFQDGDRVLFLYGIGGIGKTQIAKQYAKRFRDRYDTVIYATYNGSLKEMLIAESPFEIQPQPIRYTLSDGSQEDDKSFLLRKIDLLRKLSNERTLIILDNYDTDDDEDLPLLMNGRYHLLITTRHDHSRFYPTITVHPIGSIDALKEIFMKNYQGDDVEEDDPALVELIELVNRHTYTIELLAQHMENSGQTPTEMIAALKERGITSLNERVLSSDMKTQVAYENLLKMFRIFSLTDEERQVLMYLSLMPADGVDAREFKQWAALSSPRILKSLESRSWIVKNTVGIAVHPIIRAVIKHEMPATVENCHAFLHDLTIAIEENKTWHLKKRDKDRYGVIYKNLLSVFRDITVDTEMLYYNSEVLLSFAVDPEYAEDLAKRLYTYYVDQKGEDSYEAGRAAYKLGWLYAYNNHLPDALPRAADWLKKAEKILGSLSLTSSTERSMLNQTMVNLAKVYLLLYRQSNGIEYHSMAKTYAESNLEYVSRSYTPNDPYYNRVAGAYIQLAEVLLAGHEHTSALEMIENALSILIPRNTENDSDSMYALSQKAAILYAMERYRDAKPLARKAILGYIDFFGEDQTLIVDMYTILGDCCAALDEEDEAIDAYTRALEIAQRLYAPDARQIVELREKVCQE